MPGIIQEHDKLIKEPVLFHSDVFSDLIVQRYQKKWNV